MHLLSGLIFIGAWLAPHMVSVITPTCVSDAADKEPTNRVTAIRDTAILMTILH
jgi:hypothetical protein